MSLANFFGAVNPRHTVGDEARGINQNIHIGLVIVQDGGEFTANTVRSMGNTMGPLEPRRAETDVAFVLQDRAIFFGAPFPPITLFPQYATENYRLHKAIEAVQWRPEDAMRDFFAAIDVNPQARWLVVVKTPSDGPFDPERFNRKALLRSVQSPFKEASIFYLGGFRYKIEGAIFYVPNPYIVEESANAAMKTWIVHMRWRQERTQGQTGFDIMGKCVRALETINVFIGNFTKEDDIGATMVLEGARAADLEAAERALAGVEEVASVSHASASRHPGGVGCSHSNDNDNNGRCDQCGKFTGGKRKRG